MASFEKLQKRRAESERGAILVLTALVILLLLFIAAFSTDLGAWYRQTEEQQRAADVGSLNGISAYDRGVKDIFALRGNVSTWQELAAANPDFADEAELQGLTEATLTIQALLETSGLSFTAAPTFNLAPDPLDTSSVSTVTLTATDGSIITITRVFVETGVALDGVTPVFTRAIEVSVERTGEQYFSNILRDAPQIERNAQSLLSNCGATCNNLITFNPPFVAFEGTGNGDGYGPLLYDRPDPITGVRDGVIDEAWAVNHHSNGAATGQIICVVVATQQPCPGSTAPNDAFPLDYQTGNRPVEYIHPDGRIYFAARRASDGALGLACWNADTKSYCNGGTSEFISFWTQTQGTAFPAWINATGPFFNDGRLYIVSQDGQVACATLALNPCTVGGPNAVGGPGVDTSQLPGLNTGNLVSNGEQIGERLILTQNAATGVLFRCLDLSNNSGAVSGCGQHFQNTLGNGGDDNLTFTRYNTSGGAVGVCVLNIQTGANQCVNSSASPIGELPGLAAGLDLLSTGNWGGDTFTWTGETPAEKRTFFAGGNSDYVGCWNWQTGQACNDGPDGGGAYLLANDAYTGNGNANPYAFNQISARCVIGLGHQAVFFSFDPVGFGPCVDVTITTPIAPCDCADAAQGARWGAITLPPQLLADVEFLLGTVSVTSDSSTAYAGLEDIDLLATGGVIDLGVLNELTPPPASVFLTLEADSRLDSNGDPLFADPYTTNLEISVQPTLTE